MKTKTNSGTIYSSDCREFEIPRTEFLLHKVKEIEEQLIKWYRKNHYDQGSDYTVRITSKGKWAVGYSNDYPMQHGSGREHILTEDEFKTAMLLK